MTTIIEIDTLHFDGMTEDEGRRAAAAFERQLQDLLDREGLPEGRPAGDIDDIDLGALPTAMTSPEAKGAELARALFSELWR